jgi:hypothetical protein
VGQSAAPIEVGGHGFGFPSGGVRVWELLGLGSGFHRSPNLEDEVVRTKSGGGWWGRCGGASAASAGVEEGGGGGVGMRRKNRM